MKKVLLPAALILLVWGCSKKMTPAKSETPSSNNGSAPIMGKTSSDISTPSTNTTATTTGAVASKDSPTYGAKTVERGGSADAAAIAGQATFNAKCGRCHGLKIASDYTVDRWISVMQVMAMKANLTETEKANVLAYVTANAKH